ncbi:MAG: tyrosine-type recombinase/integrase [Cyanobacteria bacterium J06627_8]
MKRTPKGEVSIVNRDGWIQLRWRYQGVRRQMSMGLRYDPVNVAVAQRRAYQIQLDMVSGNFDVSLEKYRGGYTPQRTLGAVSLFTKFTEWKSKRVQPRTLEKYQGLLTWLREFFGDRSADGEDAEQFVQWLKENLEPVTAKERLSLLKAAWNWGIEQKKITTNPWKDLNVRKPPKKPSKAFTKDEVQRIIQGFEESPYYHHYLDYVKFRFYTGCRSGEVNGLHWRHLNEDCSVMWVGETHTHGQFADVKNNKSREVKLSGSTTAMLRSRMPANVDPDSLVFPSPKGLPIDEHNFSQRAWKKVLKEMAVDYRRPYNTRHTFVSHCLEMGMNPVEVAAITGHDVKTLYSNYAGLIKSHPQAPELF